jgi:FAD synthase
MHTFEQPLHLKGTVVTGFGRGSKLLQIPTANIYVDPDKLSCYEIGIYYGWATLQGETYKMCVSIGWNPYFKNEQKTIEAHLLHEFEQDFYGETLELDVVGFIREERDFGSLDELKAAIMEDIDLTRETLVG